MKSEIAIKGLLEQKKAILNLQTPRVGLTWKQTEVLIRVQIDTLNWILED